MMPRSCCRRATPGQLPANPPEFRSQYTSGLTSSVARAVTDTRPQSDRIWYSHHVLRTYTTSPAYALRIHSPTSAALVASSTTANVFASRRFTSPPRQLSISSHKNTSDSSPSSSVRRRVVPLPGWKSRLPPNCPVVYMRPLNTAMSYGTALPSWPPVRESRTNRPLSSSFSTNASLDPISLNDGASSLSASATNAPPLGSKSTSS